MHRLIRQLLACALAAFAALVALPASAAGPALASATVDVRPDANGSASVNEQISLKRVAAGAKIDNVMPVFPGVTVDDLRITAGGSAVDFSSKRAAGVRHLSFPAPSSGTLDYTIAYTVHSNGATNLPLAVPAATPAGPGRPVELKYEVPSGYYLQGDPFPMAPSDRGTITRSLDAMPSFVDFTIGRSPASIFTASNIYSGLVILVIAAFVVVWIVTERRAMRRGAVGV